MSSKIRVLVVDDHAILREGVRALLQIHPDIEVVGEAGDGAHALGHFPFRDQPAPPDLPA